MFVEVALIRTYSRIRLQGSGLANISLLAGHYAKGSQDASGLNGSLGSDTGRPAAISAGGDSRRIEVIAVPSCRFLLLVLAVLRVLCVLRGKNTQ